MEFSKKLQELRKAKNLTQDELAQALYVSRTAVSKWESGRGYPNIDSLKTIAAFFSVSIDELLSGNDVLSIAEEETVQNENRMRSLVFGLLDCSIAMLAFLPVFGQNGDGMVKAVSLISLEASTVWLKVCYFSVIFAAVAVGIFTLAAARQMDRLRTLSLAFSMLGLLLFILSRQPYAAAFVLMFLAIKVFILLKRR